MISWPQKTPVLERLKNKWGVGKLPKLTIITPSYNQGRFLEETILSVLNQGYPNLEYIIIDGGSTDESVEIIKRYSDKIKYWVSERDKGQTHAINKGLQHATGEIIGWINSDDMYMPWTFRNVMAEFQKKPNIKLLWGSRVLLGADSEILGFSFATEFRPESMNFCINSETAFWKADINNKIGGLNEDLKFAMDLDFFSRIFNQYPTSYIAALQGCFRCYAQNKSSTMQDVCLAETVMLWEKLFNTRYVPTLKRRNFMRFFAVFKLMKHPILLLLPYIFTRIKRTTA